MTDILMNYLEALHLLKTGKRTRIGRTDSKNNISMYYKYDFHTGLILCVQYKEQRIGESLFWGMYYQDSYEMTVQEFIKKSKENNYKFW